MVDRAYNKILHWLPPEAERLLGRLLSGLSLHFQADEIVLPDKNDVGTPFIAWLGILLKDQPSPDFCIVGAVCRQKQYRRTVR